MALRHFPFLYFIIATLWNQSFGQTPTPNAIDKLFKKGFELRFESMDSAYKIVHKSFMKSKDIGYDEGRWRAIAFSVSYLTQKDELDSARILTDSLLAQIRNTDHIDNFIEGISYYYSGNLFQALQKFDTARNCYFKALPLFENMKEFFFIGSLYIGLGDIEYIQGNYTDALDYFLKAYEVKDNLRPEMFVTLLHDIALCYFDLNQIDEAKSYVKRAIRINGDIESESLARNFLFLARLFNKSTQNDSAYYYFNRSIFIAKKEGIQDVVFQSKLGIANLQAASNLKASDIILKSLMDEIPEHNRNLYLVQLYSSLTGNSLSKGEYREVVHYATKIFHLKLDHQFDYLRFASSKLDLAYEKLGIYDSALYYNKKVVQYTDSLNIVDERKRFTKLYARIQTLEKENEITRLQNQRIVSARNRSILTITFVATTILAILIVVIVRYRSKIAQKKIMIESIKLRNDMESRERDFERQALNMANLSSRVSEFEGIIKSLKSKESKPSKADLQSLRDKISLTKSLEIEWEKFEEYFRKVHKEFISAIFVRHHDLSPTDLRLIALIKLGLSGREMASILNVELKSINTYKYRLKKKFNLRPEEDLEVYLHMLENISVNKEVSLN